MGSGSWGLMKINQVLPVDWISVDVSKEHENKARDVRAERDRQYGNIFKEAKTDERWVGDLGEMVFDAWLKSERVEGFVWIQDDAAGKADFVLPLNIHVGVKTVKRKVAPRDGYTAQITARHAEEPIEQFFFMSYEISERRMWMLGGIDRARFLKEARYYGAGEFVHKDYQIRPGHEIYNIEISKLVRPKIWLLNCIRN